MPVGAELIENSVSRAPGFSIGNVHVMAGVPAIMQAMLDALAPRLNDRAAGAVALDRGGPQGGRHRHAARGGPGRFPDVKIGSYPTFDEKAGFTTTLVLRSRDAARLDAAGAGRQRDARRRAGEAEPIAHGPFCGAVNRR